MSHNGVSRGQGTYYNLQNSFDGELNPILQHYGNLYMLPEQHIYSVEMLRSVLLAIMKDDKRVQLFPSSGQGNYGGANVDTAGSCQIKASAETGLWKVE